MAATAVTMTATINIATAKSNNTDLFKRSKENPKLKNLLDRIYCIEAFQFYFIFLIFLSDE